MKYTILGEGAWGTAIATVLAHNGHDVMLWCYNSESVDAINSRHINQEYMPDVQLSERIQATDRLDIALNFSDWIFEAIPVKYLRSVLEQCKGFYSKKQTWIVLSKGIENETLLFPTQLIQDVFSDVVATGVLSGPSFAREVVEKKQTAVVAASDSESIAQELTSAFSNDYFDVKLSNDTIGVQAGGALKNVVTLLMGIAEGCGWADNTKALLFTQGFAEVVEVAQAYGSQATTLYGLSGLGDLYLCATGSLSRNLMVGTAIGKGESVEEVVQRTGCIPESVNSVQSLHDLMKQKQLSYPLLDALYRVVHKNVEPKLLLTFNE